MWIEKLSLFGMNASLFYRLAFVLHIDLLYYIINRRIFQLF